MNLRNVWTDSSGSVRSVGDPGGRHALVNGDQATRRGRRARAWVAALSVVSLLLLGASPALATGEDPNATGAETVAPAAGSDGVVSETPQETPPPAPVVEEPPMPPAETPAPVPPISEEPTAAPDPVAESTGADSAQNETDVAPATAAPAAAKLAAESNSPEPPYLRWVAVNSSGVVLEQGDLVVSVQGPRDAADAGDELLWADASIATVPDNTGQEGYAGADLDARAGYFTIKQVVDDADPTSVHDVMAGERYRLRPAVAEGFTVGDEANWTLVASLASADEAVTELVLAQSAESSQAAAKATPDPAALAIAPLAAALTQGTYKPDKDDSAPTDWRPSPSGSTIPGQALLNNLSSAVSPEGGGWRYTSSWDREGTEGAFGWTFEYTNAPERWGAANTLDGSGNPTDQSVPQPNRSAGGTTIKIENNATTARICTYTSQSNYPGDWANSTRCRQVTAAVSYTNGGLHVSVSFLLPAALFGSPGCPPTFGSTSYARSWTGTAMNLQAWHTPQAFTPPSNCGTTTLKITKMGDRNGTPLIAGDQLTEAVAVAGARFDAYASTSAGQPTGASLGFCITDSNGFCTIAVSNENTNGVWVQETSAPAGWDNMPSLGIGDYDQNKTVTPYRFRVAVGNGSNNVTRNVTTDRNLPNSAVSHAWVDVRNNPEFPEYCGVSIAMVFDTSTSISQSEMNSFKAAAQAFVGNTALGGTPSSATMFSFSTAASKLNGGTPYDLSIAGSAAGNTGYLGAINRISNGLPSQGDGYTNWDGALRLVKQTGNYDMVLFLTDGDPTTYGVTGSDTNTSVQFRMVEQAAMSANALKASTGPSGGHTKIVGVGVGLTSGSDQNLKAITGPTLGDDYFLAADFNALQAKLQEIAVKNCGGSLTVVKKTIDAAGNTIAESAPGWEFEASTAGAFIENPPNARVGALKKSTPSANFVIDLESVESRSVTIKETAQSGWTPDSVSCTGGAASGVAGNFSVTVARNKIVTCTVVNREVPKDASIAATKVWVVQNGAGQEVLRANQTTATVPASLPPGISAQFSATGPGAAPSGGLAWGATRGGYKIGDSVTVSESVTIPSSLPGCSVVSQKLTKLNGATVDIDLKGTSYTHALVARTPATTPVNLNEFEATNTIKCSTQLTLLKQVQGGDANPNKWTITATGPTGPHSATGSSSEGPSNTFEVQPGGSYALTEALAAGGPMTYLLDRIERCAARDAGGSCTSWTTVLDVSAVSVAIGTHETYRFVNKPAPAVIVPLTGGLSGELFGSGGLGLAALAIILAAMYWRRIRRQSEVR